MTYAQKNIAIKKSQHRMVTIVTSVNGRPLHEAAPGLRNEFESNVDAIVKVQLAIGKRPDQFKTRRVSLAQAAISR